MIYHANTYRKKVTRSIFWNKKGYSHPTTITDIILHMYTPNNRFNYVKQILTEIKEDKSLISKLDKSLISKLDKSSLSK